MEESNVNSEVEEVATHEDHEEEQQVGNKSTMQSQYQETEQERNWRAVRHRIKQLEEENKKKDELISQALLARNKNVEEEEEEIDPDDYVKYAGIEKISKKTLQPLESKIADLEKRIAEQQQRELMHSLKVKYSDFDSVVNPKTLEILEKKEPELAQTILEIGDPYKMGIQSYKYIKALGLAEDTPSKRRQKETAKILKENESTVQSPHIFEKRPMAQAFHMTEDEKSSLYAEMMACASQAQFARPLGS